MTDKRYRKRRLPRNIADPVGYDGYQVRVVRQGIEYSRSFSRREHGGKRKALAAAVEWRDAMIDALPPANGRLHSYLTRPLLHNRSFARAGITRYLSRDSRRQGNPKYVRYGVCWTDALGNRRIKSFQAGRADDPDHAMEVRAAQTAIAFRENWEHCIDTGQPFDPSQYNCWRERALYPFKARRRRR